MISLETERQIRREWEQRAERMQPWESDMAICKECYATYSDKRKELGYDICMDCGDSAAYAQRITWCIVPTPKGHYTRVTRKDELKQLNQKTR